MKIAMLLATAAAIAPRAFMNDMCDTVVVSMGGNKVRVNKSDYDANPDDYGAIDKKATKDQPDATVAGSMTNIHPDLTMPPAPSAPDFRPADGETPQAGPVTPTTALPDQKFVKQDGKKWFVVDATANVIDTVDGLDKTGYDSEKAAWDAIMALPH